MLNKYHGIWGYKDGKVSVIRMIWDSVVPGVFVAQNAIATSIISMDKTDILESVPKEMGLKEERAKEDEGHRCEKEEERGGGREEPDGWLVEVVEFKVDRTNS